MARKTRKCTCCHKEYEYCPTCHSDKSKHTWSTIFCSESCMRLWETATQYNMNILTKDEAKEVITKLELKDKTAYVECIQRDLDNILTEGIMAAEEPAPILEEPAEEIAPIFEEKPVFTSKKKHKSHEVVKKEYK